MQLVQRLEQIFTPIMGLVAGLAVAFALFGTPGLESSEVRRHGTGDRAAPAEPGAAAASAPVSEDRAEPRPALDQLIDQTLAAGAEGGEGTVTGIVRDVRGQPVAGVQVRLVAYPPSRDSARADGLRSLDLRPQLEHTLADAGFQARNVHTTTSAADGTFALRALSRDLAYEVRASAPGHEVAAVDHSNRVRPDATFDLVARATAPVTFRVTHQDVLQEHAKIHFEARDDGGGGMAGRFDWTSGNPTEKLCAGRYELHATVAEELASPRRTVQVEAGTPATVTLPLERRRGVKGRVALPWGDRSFAGVELRDDLGNRAGRAHATERHPEFSILDVPSGRYELVVAQGTDDELRREIVVQGGILDVGLLVPTAPAEGAPATPRQLRIWVLDPEGERVTDARVELTVEAFHRSTGRNTQHAGADGSYLLKLPSSDWNEQGWESQARCTVQVHHDQLGRQAREFRLGAETEVTVRYEPACDLIVRLPGYASSPWSDLPIRGRIHGTDPATERIEVSAKARGETITWPRLPPGTYELRLRAKRSIDLAQRDLTLAAGTRELVVPFPELHELLVTVPPDLADGQFRLEPVDANGTRGYLNAPAEEGVRFGPLHPGDYRLHGPGGCQRVRIPLDHRVVFEPRPTDAYAVRLDDPTGLLGAAGLRQGDLLVGVDGQRLASPEEIRVALEGAGESATLLLLRDGNERELTLDPKLLFLPVRESGGWLNHASTGE